MSTPQAPTQPRVETIVRIGVVLWSVVGLIVLLTGARSSPWWQVWGVVEVAFFVAIIMLGVRKVRRV